jgi:hypothetical protein
LHQRRESSRLEQWFAYGRLGVPNLGKHRQPHRKKNPRHGSRSCPIVLLSMVTVHHMLDI